MARNEQLCVFVDQISVFYSRLCCFSFLSGRDAYFAFKLVQFCLFSEGMCVVILLRVTKLLVVHYPKKGLLSIVLSLVTMHVFSQRTRCAFLGIDDDGVRVYLFMALCLALCTKF